MQSAAHRKPTGCDKLTTELMFVCAAVFSEMWPAFLSVRRRALLAKVPVCCIVALGGCEGKVP
jgi:hypothetical protein